MSPATGQKAAKRGYKCQSDFLNLVNLDSNFNARLKKSLNLDKERLIAKKPLSNIEKTDVVLVVLPDKEIGCSIKAAEINFNQLERVWLKDLASDIKMPKNIEEAIQACIDNRRLKKSKKFISGAYSQQIVKYFSGNMDVLLNRIFTRNNPLLRYFIVYDYTNKKWHISEITTVINYIKKQPITISNGGVLYFGDSLTLQKKGGNGSHIKIPKSNPAHPGNQIQFKIKPLSIVRNILSTKTI